MKPSNPIPNYYYNNGDTPFYVAIELSHWIPVSVIVFANNKKEAKKIVKDGIAFALKDKKNRIIPEDAPKLLSKKAKISIHKLSKKQLYQTGWAWNDTIF